MADDDFELGITWERTIGRSPEARSALQSLLARYRQPGRHYHGTRHVRWVVRHVIDLAWAADDAGAVIAAAFFHDAVYDPARTDNESASAQLADRTLTELGWETPRRRHVMQMIEATASHDVEAADRDTQVLLAADLAVLAAEPARYSDYTRAVRREYGHVGDDQWRTGRTAVLRGLLGRPHLFAPALELHEWEHRARANITAELAALRA